MFYKRLLLKFYIPLSCIDNKSLQSVLIIFTEEIAALDVGIASAMSNVITLMGPARTDALKVSRVPTVLKVLSVYLLLNGINDDTNAILYIVLLHPTR